MKKTISLVRAIRIRKAKKTAKMVLFALFTAMVIFFIFSVVSVGARNRRNALEVEERENCESEFIQRSREYLNGRGYGFAGVNLTKMTNDEGGYEYHLLLCHERFANLNDDTEFLIKRDLDEIKKECSLGRMDIEFF